MRQFCVAVALQFNHASINFPAKGSQNNDSWGSLGSVIAMGAIAMACAPEPFDVLEFGETLVAARPDLRRRATPLTRSPEEADRLVERTLKRGWLERRSFRDTDEVHAWLAGQLISRH
jgi:hypothetical protein